MIWLDVKPQSRPLSPSLLQSHSVNDIHEGSSSHFMWSITTCCWRCGHTVKVNILCVWHWFLSFSITPLIITETNSCIIVIGERTIDNMAITDNFLYVELAGVLFVKALYVEYEKTLSHSLSISFHPPHVWECDVLRHFFKRMIDFNCDFMHLMLMYQCFNVNVSEQYRSKSNEQWEQWLNSFYIMIRN